MPKLVLLPGMDGTGELFSEFVAGLPATFDAVTVRYPTKQFLPYSKLGDLVRAACPSSEPFTLIAESFSAPLALKYAATNPVNLRGLVLCAGFASSPLRGWRKSLASLLASFVFYVPAPRFAAKRWLVGSNAPPSLLDAVRTAISTVKPWVLAARLREVLVCDARDDIVQINVPILYIRAAQDRLVSALCLEELRRINPNFQVAVVDGPHLLLQREPEAGAEIVVSFLQAGR